MVRALGLFMRGFQFRSSLKKWPVRKASAPELVLCVEVTLNNRPCSYLEDDIQLPVLTRNSMLYISLSYLPESPAHQLPEKDVRKPAKFLLKCKEAMWKWWTSEYVRSLREQHRQAGGKQTPCPLKVGDVVIIEDSSKNRNHWRLAVITDLIKGRDGIVRAARIKSSKRHPPQACNHLRPLELACVKEPASPEFIRPRSKKLMLSS